MGQAARALQGRARLKKITKGTKISKTTSWPCVLQASSFTTTARSGLHRSYRHASGCVLELYLLELYKVLLPHGLLRSAILASRRYREHNRNLSFVAERQAARFIAEVDAEEAGRVFARQACRAV